MTTEEGNKIISDFDCTKSFDTYFNSQRKFHFTIEEAEYHTSWDWLMPVVEKIGEFGVWNIRPGCVQLENYRGERSAENMFKFSSRTMDWETEFDEPIEFKFLVWHICVKFIKWYNG